MRNPIDVLTRLNEKARDKSYRFQRLYRNLYNPEFYYVAYRNIRATDGSMTQGIDGSNMDGMSQGRFDRIIQALQDQSYQPLPARRTYIEKKNSTKKRPLGIQAGNDKLVEEVIRMMLESIFENDFSKSSHGFRQFRSCHTALTEIKKTFTGSVWFVEGDISACFDSFDHHVLIGLLRRRIDDEKFIALMWKFLKAGYMEKWVFHETYSGTPQGSGMSPVLANIYLTELDNYMASYQANFQVGKKGDYRYDPCYMHECNRIKWLQGRNRLVWDTLDPAEKRERAKTLRQMQNQKLRMPAFPIRDTRWKKLQYVRYADDFLIGLIGSKADAEKLKNDLGVFLKESMKLTLSDTKTKITHTSEKARFLGYDITVIHSQEIRKSKHGRNRAFNGKVRLLMPHEKWVGKLLEYEAIRMKPNPNGGKDVMKAVQRNALLNHRDIDILRKYDAETRGLYNYYSIASNVSALWNFAMLMKRSMLKSFANKYRAPSREIRERYEEDGVFTIRYKTRQGEKKAEFIHSFRQRDTLLYENVDTLPPYRRYDRTNSLALRLKAKVCELCGKRNCSLEMHQVRKLKDLVGGSQWEQVMKDNRRKTLAVCHDCHKAIHASA